MPQTLRVHRNVCTRFSRAALEKQGAMASTKETLRSRHIGLRTSEFSVVCVRQRNEIRKLPAGLQDRKEFGLLHYDARGGSDWTPCRDELLLGLQQPGYHCPQVINLPATK